MATSLGLSTAAPSDDAQADDDFSVDFDDDEAAPSYEAIVEALTDEATQEEAVDKLIEASITAIAVEKGQKDEEAALKALSEANAKLVSVDLTRAAARTYPAIDKQLEAIEGLVKRLRTKLTELS